MLKYNEFPAYLISDSTNKNTNPSVVFCVIGNEFSDSFVNNWTSFLFSIEIVKSKIDPHFVNYYDEDISKSRNTILSGDDSESLYRNLFYAEWEYDYIFFLDSQVSFNPNNLIDVIVKMEKLRGIDILTHNKNSIDNFDLKFTVFRKNIFERIAYPWFEENKNIDKLFIQKLIDMKLNMVIDDSTTIK